MQERNYWPLLFIGLFLFTFSMIIWTIYSAVKTPVHEDEVFLKKYQDVDKNFNDIVNSNKAFLAKYNFEIIFNDDKKFALVIDDMFKAQRVIEKSSLHKNAFIKGKNKVAILITDKKGNIIKNLDINFRISRPTNHKYTRDFKSKDFEFKNEKFITYLNLPLKGNWNITANFRISNDIGYLYIKSNALQQ